MRAKEFISEVGAGTKQQFKVGDSNAEIPRIAAGMGKDNSYDPDKYTPNDQNRIDNNTGMVSIKTGDNERDIYNQQGGVARVGSASGTRDINMNTGQTLRSQSQDIGGTTVGKDHVAGTTTTNTNIGGKSQERTTKDGSGQELKNRETWDMGAAQVYKNREGGKENIELGIPQTNSFLRVDAKPVGKGGKVDVLQKDGSYRQAHIDDLGTSPSVVTNPNDADQSLMRNRENWYSDSQADSYGARGEIAPGTPMKKRTRPRPGSKQRVY